MLPLLRSSLLLRYCLIGGGGLTLVMSGGTIGFSALSNGEDVVLEPIIRHDGGSSADPEHLRVATLNVAHGRAMGFHQALQSEERIKEQLAAAAALLAAEDPDLIALQEADSPSAWSGGFDHVAFFADHTDSRAYAAGKHIDAFGLRYGTAVLSQTPIHEARSSTFAISPPTPAKGWVLSTVQVGAVWVDVVSVHLDFSRESVRTRQVTELVEALQARPHPLVLMGDLNTEWDDDDSAVARLCRELGLHTWAPSEALVTFPTTKSRLDWILVSEELEFTSHRVLDAPVSDHRAVVADLRLR